MAQLDNFEQTHGYGRLKTPNTVITRKLWKRKSTFRLNL